MGSGSQAPVRTFGELLRQHRLAAGLAQDTLAERAHLSVETISALERGVRQKPYLETIALLAEALDLSSVDRAELERAADRRITEPLSNNLPVARTSFVGRERDAADVKELLQSYRLLTLVGSGGVGKTRLAIQVGTEVLDRYPDGVWFVDFAPISDRELVASVVAQALGMSQRQGRRIDEMIPQWLRHKQLLLIFDNCEHVLETTAVLADAILTLAPEVRIIATSRQAFDVSGEAVHHLKSLAVPPAAIELTRDSALRYSAIALFVDRATAADTRFALNDENAPAIAEICRRLDGIALTIELAAARVNVLSIPNLAQRLNERFTLLTGRNRSALPRQKTLTALLDWSYDLLSPQEQRLFARLGIFAGGFDLNAVTAACGAGELNETGTFDLLASLTEKSLVVTDTTRERERYRLLETTAAYALEKLDATGERERFERRHAEYFCAQAQAADQRFGSGSTLAWRAGVEAELDNYRAALEWAVTRRNDAALGGTIAGALERLWREAGLVAEGRYWIELALPLVSEREHPAIAGRLQLALSLFSAGKLRYEAAERAMELYQSVNDVRGAVRARGLRAFALVQMGNLDEAREATAAVLEASRELGDGRNVAYSLNQLASIEASRGDLRAAREAGAQALSGMKARGDEFGIALVLGFMAEMEFAAGDAEHALRLAQEALEVGSPGKNLTLTATWQVNIAAYSIALNDLSSARAAAHEGLRISRRVRNESSLAIAFQHLASLATIGGDSRRGARLLGHVDARYDELGMKRETTEQRSYDTLMAMLRESLDNKEIEMLATEGAVWSEDRAVAEALKV